VEIIKEVFPKYKWKAHEVFCVIGLNTKTQSHEPWLCITSNKEELEMNFNAVPPASYISRINKTTFNKLKRSKKKPIL
jgi:hypothetical protein